MSETLEAQSKRIFQAVLRYEMDPPEIEEEFLRAQARGRAEAYLNAAAMVIPDGNPANLIPKFKSLAAQAGKEAQ